MGWIDAVFIEFLITRIQRNLQNALFVHYQVQKGITSLIANPTEGKTGLMHYQQLPSLFNIAIFYTMSGRPNTQRHLLTSLMYVL